MILPHADPGLVASHVIDAVGNRLPARVSREIVDAHVLRRAHRLPFRPPFLKFPPDGPDDLAQPCGYGVVPTQLFGLESSDGQRSRYRSVWVTRGKSSCCPSPSVSSLTLATIPTDRKIQGNSRAGTRMTPPGPVVGIDVAKAELVVAVRPGGDRWTVPNNEAGVARLRARLQQLVPTLVVLEATGGYERAAVAALAAVQLPVVVANPRQVRDFARATGQLADPAGRAPGAGPAEPPPHRCARGRRAVRLRQWYPAWPAGRLGWPRPRADSALYELFSLVPPCEAGASTGLGATRGFTTGC